MSANSGQDVGKIAYDAYCRSVGGVSAITGATLPEFHDTKHEIRVAWTAAAEAVLRHRPLQVDRYQD